LPQSVLATLADGTEIRNGGFGSAMTAHPVLSDHFYTLTDQGPNRVHDGPSGPGKIFAVPDFNPHIALFRLTSDNAVELVRTIPLRTRSGTPVSGLPSAEFGATGEVPYALDGSELAFDPAGLDPEGLVALADGTFWVGDEYGPHLVHFDAEGVEIGRINPYPDDQRVQLALPPEFAARRPNRGMEGLAASPDGATLVGIMQSALENPLSARGVDLTRIVAIDLSNGAIAQYLYRQDEKELSNSEIAALPDGAFLVIERDGGFAGDGSAHHKKIYKIDLNGATNVDRSNQALIASDPELGVDEDAGLLVAGQTLEEVIAHAGDDPDAGWARLEAKGIVPVRKTLVVDALKDFDFPHDKLEGLWVRGPLQIGVINDDDFAVASGGEGELVQKLLPDGTADRTILYLVDLAAPVF